MAQGHNIGAYSKKRMTPSKICSLLLYDRYPISFTKLGLIYHITVPPPQTAAQKNVKILICNEPDSVTCGYKIKCSLKTSTNLLTIKFS